MSLEKVWGEHAKRVNSSFCKVSKDSIEKNDDLVVKWLKDLYRTLNL